MGFGLSRSKLKDPQTMVVGAPPPPQRATLPLALAPISRKLHLGRVRGLSRKTIEVPRASKKQSPPVRGIGSGIPSTLSQQLPRETMAKCAKSVGEIFLSEGVTFSLVCFYQAPRGCGFEPVLTESGYVQRSEDVCYRVQLSLPLLLKAIVFCENCTGLHTFACWRSADSGRRALH